MKKILLIAFFVALLIAGGCGKTENTAQNTSVISNLERISENEQSVDVASLAAKWTEYKLSGNYSAVIDEYEGNTEAVKKNKTLTEIYNYCIEANGNYSSSSNVQNMSSNVTSEMEESEIRESSKSLESFQMSEESRRVEESRLAEESRRAEESRLTEESRRAEESRLAEESRRAEESRLAEESRRAEESRLAEESRRAEESRLAEESAQNIAYEAQNSIKIIKLDVSAPNSAGGVDVYIDFYNRSGKTIKYVYYEVQAYNAVDDPVSCEIRGNSIAKLNFTGPVENGCYSNNQAEYEEALRERERIENASYDYPVEVPYVPLSNTYWDCVWYNYSIKYCKLVSVRIVYMDNTELNLDKNSVSYIL